MILVTLVSLATVATDLYIPSIPLVAKSFRTSINTAQLSLSSYMFGFALSTFLSGFVSDHIGIRKTLLGGLGVFILASVICFISTSIEVLISARFLQALGGCCTTVLTRLLVRRMFPAEEQINALSWLTTGLCIASALAPVLGSAIAAELNWKIDFILLAVIGLVLFFVCSIWLKNYEETTNLNHLTSKNILWEIIRNKIFIKYTLVISLSWAAYFSFIVSSANIFQIIFENTILEYGYLMMLFSAIEVVGSTVARWLNNRLSPNFIVFVTSAVVFLVGLSSTLFSLNGKLTELTMSLHFSIAIFAIGILMPYCQFLTLNLFPSFSGTAMAIFYTVEMVVGGVASVLVSLISSDSIFATSFVCLICGCGMILLTCSEFKKNTI